jgi:hypothetical protein
LARTPASDAALPSSLHGEVMDHDGEVCEGASVELRTSSGVQHSQISGNNGQFDFAPVPAGSFTLTVSAGGFVSATVTGTLSAGQALILPAIVLTPSSVVSEVRVSAASPAEIATEDLHIEEKQRVLGIVPNFYVVYDRNAPPLSSKQKFQLAWRASYDPFTFASDGAAAGIEQAFGLYKGYGNGAAGYARRFGAAYGDDFIGDMIGGAILPSLLHQDPRYFYKGTGSKSSRLFYAVAASFICKNDNGRQQLNYSSIAGDFAAAGISNAYYPAGDRNSASAIVGSVALDKLSDSIQNIFQEFVARRFTPKLPSYGSNP